MPAGFVNQLRRGVQFDDCENTNRGLGHRYAMGSDAGVYYRLGRPRASVTPDSPSPTERSPATVGRRTSNSGRNWSSAGFAPLFQLAFGLATRFSLARSFSEEKHRTTKEPLHRWLSAD